MVRLIALFGIVVLSTAGLAARSGKSWTTEVNGTPASARELYMRHCSSCHGRNGQPRHKGARNFTDHDWQERVSDERIFNVISNGKGRMPGFSKKLSDADIDSLVQYVRGMKK